MNFPFTYKTIKQTIETFKRKTQEITPHPTPPFQDNRFEVCFHVFLAEIHQNVYLYRQLLVSWLVGLGVFCLFVCLGSFFFLTKNFFLAKKKKKSILYILFCNLLVFYSPMHKEPFSRSPYQLFSFFSILTLYSLVHIYYFFQLFLSLNNQKFSTGQLTSFVYLSLYSKLFSNSKILNSPKIKSSSLEKETEKLFSWSN